MSFRPGNGEYHALVSRKRMQALCKDAITLGPIFFLKIHTLRLFSTVLGEEYFIITGFIIFNLFFLNICLCATFKSTLCLNIIRCVIACNEYLLTFYGRYMYLIQREANSKYMKVPMSKSALKVNTLSTLCNKLGGVISIHA